MGKHAQAKMQISTARCKGPTLLAKTTPENEGEAKSAENISQRHTAKWPSVIDEVNYWFKHTFPDNVTLNHPHTKCDEIKKAESDESENMPRQNANVHFPVPKVLWKSQIWTVGIGILFRWPGFFFTLVLMAGSLITLLQTYNIIKPEGG